MNLDFHYYGTFAAACLAGYSQEEAEIIAYAAQYVDESNKDMIIPLKGLTQYPTYQTVDELMDMAKKAGFRPWYKEELNTFRRIWMCFHFLPGNFEGRYSYNGAKYKSAAFTKPWRFQKKDETNFKLMCLQNSELAADMINDIRLYHRNQDYILELIGIRMHVLLDTWSHCFYIGKPEWYINDAGKNVLEWRNDEWKKLEFNIAIVHDLPEQGIYKCTPDGLFFDSTSYLGHGRMGSTPDYGYLNYKYEPQWLSQSTQEDKKVINKNNEVYFIKAFTQMVYALSCIRSNTYFAAGSYEELEPPIPGILKKIFNTRLIDQSPAWKNNLKDLVSSTIKDFDKETWKKHTDINSNYYRFQLSVNKHIDFVNNWLESKGVSLYEYDEGYQGVRIFDDAPVMPFNNLIKSIYVYTKETVNYIEILYDNGAIRRHGMRMNGDTEKSFDFENDEHILSIEYTEVDFSGATGGLVQTIGGMTIRTTRRNIPVQGTGDKCSIKQTILLKAPEGQRIFALRGRAVFRQLASAKTITYLQSLNISYCKPMP